jgi:hypothetical protein
MKSIKPLHAKVTEDASAEPDTGLPTLIRMANMVPSAAELPQFPDEKCVRLGKDYLNDVVQKREFARFVDENFPRDKFAEFREFLDEGVNHAFRPREMYTFVRETREALTMLATHQKERSLFNVNFYFPWEQVGGWNVDRIRVCENCGNLFFANRNNKLTCSDPCSTARRVREWRKHQDQYEQARKLKSARRTKNTRAKAQKQKQSSSRKRGSQGGKNGAHKTR